MPGEGSGIGSTEAEERLNVDGQAALCIVRTRRTEQNKTRSKGQLGRPRTAYTSFPAKSPCPTSSAAARTITPRAARAGATMSCYVHILCPCALDVLRQPLQPLKQALARRCATVNVSITTPRRFTMIVIRDKQHSPRVHIPRPVPHLVQTQLFRDFCR